MNETNGPLAVCPISQHYLQQPAVREIFDDIGPGWKIECPHCGRFVIGNFEYSHLIGYLGFAETEQRRQRHRAVLAHAVRRMATTGQTPVLARDGMVLQILEEDRLPSLTEQRDNLLRWFENETDFNSFYAVGFDQIGAIVGAPSPGAFSLLLGGMVDRGLLAGSGALDGSYSCRLTLTGLERLEELQNAAPSGFNAFMAMKFDDERLDRIVENNFKPAVRATGFELYRLDDKPAAGLIDARLRNEIRNCRFLIADLSHGNAGAYWEAGYAEGLGKPVIYTCEKSVFDGKSNISKPHFDTNHHLTIVWEEEKPAEAAAKLADTIRFTIPEARQGTRF